MAKPFPGADGNHFKCTCVSPAPAVRQNHVGANGVADGVADTMFDTAFGSSPPATSQKSYVMRFFKLSTRALVATLNLPALTSCTVP